jgi:hypothetical protein
MKPGRITDYLKPLDNVIVKSGDKTFEGIIESIEWDFDQYIYLINGEWFCQSEVNFKPKLQIIQVNAPSFEYDGKDLYVESKMYKDLKQFQDDVEEHEKKGATKCFFYSLHTQHDPNTNMVIYWIRCKFIK